ncbi:SDR family NAD(P)-dependent oxidoreductase [Sphingobium sp. 15-1]|uniref:SDR family NAD(P)-dependent oxidoreductase n=1 Tax=Sphingobium sp. 15-1 TaxID=2729616 RepID=UPI00159C2CAA|nr:glucose 1-dehydrogenase [Sphingobium sp. 15-1]
MNMIGKTALVTGGGSGIGRAACLALARAGAAVIIAERSAAAGEAVAKEIKALQGQAGFIPVDVGERASVADMMKQAVADFGKIDCAFNNAGIVDGSRSLLTSTQENWDAIMSVNLQGVWLCMQAQLDHMIANGGGSIVNNASRSGLRGVPTDAVYGAAKHGVVGLTKAAAVEFGSKGVRVNAICPGLVDTPLTRERFGVGFDEKATMANPMQRAALPEEIAAAVLWLCSDASSFVNGVALPIDGGSVAR